MGATGRDGTFIRNIKGAEAAGLVALAYGFAYPKTSSAVAEADALVSVANSVGGVHGLVLDVEGAGVPSDVGVDALTQYIIDWFARIESHGYIGILYVNLDFLRNRIHANKLSNKLLWVADYGVSSPPVVDGWHATFWQYTSSGNVPGISGRVDLDYFYGSKSDLENLKGGKITVSTLLKVGSTGSDVKAMQEKLKVVLGLNDKFIIDGDFGPQTLAAVKSFQTQWHLHVDGLAGPNTLGALDKAYAEKTAKPAQSAPAPVHTQPADPAPVQSNPTQTIDDIKAAMAKLQDALSASEQQSASEIAQLQAQVKSLQDQLTSEKSNKSTFVSDLDAIITKYKG